MLTSIIIDTVQESVKSISSRRMKSSLTILGAAIGVCAFAVVTGLTASTRAQVNGRFNSLQTTEVVVSDTQSTPTSIAFPSNSEKLADRLTGVLSSGVLFQANVPLNHGVTRLPGTSSLGPDNSVEVMGASPGLFLSVHATMATGRPFGGLADQLRQNVVVLGKSAAQQLGIQDISAQPAVLIGGVPFTVLGIVRSVSREASLLGDAIIPDRTASRFWGIPAHGSDLIVATRPGAAAVVAAELPAAILPTDPSRLSIVSSTSPFILQAAINNDVSRLLLLAATVALILGALGIASFTSASVLERYFEIGLRRALGSTRTNIVSQFLAESALLGACGGVAAGSAAVVILVLISNANGWYAVLSPPTITFDPLIGAAVGCVAGAYPALRAARLSPAEALRR